MLDTRWLTGVRYGAEPQKGIKVQAEFLPYPFVAHAKKRQSRLGLFLLGDEMKTLLIAIALVLVPSLASAQDLWVMQPVRPVVLVPYRPVQVVPVKPVVVERRYWTPLRNLLFGRYRMLLVPQQPQQPVQPQQPIQKQQAILILR